MTDTLKPCPFCGSEELSTEDAALVSAVYCSCEAMMGYFDNLDEAIAAWNRRTGTEVHITGSANMSPETQEAIVEIIRAAQKMAIEESKT